MDASWLPSSLVASMAALICFLLWVLTLGYCLKLMARIRRLGVQKEQACEAQLHIQQQLHKLTRTDALTGVWNRQRFAENAEAELKRCQRYTHPLSVLCIDLDHFNEINNSYGHSIGDEVLNGVARLLQSAIRQSDALGRWSGGSFMLLLPHTPLEQALELAEKLRQRIASSNLLVDSPVAVSIGAASLQPNEALETLFQRAEMALSQAKREGRNRTLGCLSELPLATQRGRQAV